MRDEIKHTPGPWQAASHPSSIVGWPVVGPRTRAICSVHMRKGETEEGRQINAEAEANAKLIAAAPDLLEALRQTVAALNGLPCRQQALDDAMRAILKATGAA